MTMRGMTLLEVTVIVLLLACILLPLAGHFSTATGDVQVIVTRQIAENGAGEMVGQLMSLPAGLLEGDCRVSIPPEGGKVALRLRDGMEDVLFFSAVPGSASREIFIQRVSATLASATFLFTTGVSPRTTFRRHVLFHDLGWQYRRPAAAGPP